MFVVRIIITLVVLSFNTVLFAAGPEVQWEKTYGIEERDEWVFSVLQTSDGGFMFLGNHEPIDSTNLRYNDIYLLRTNENGDSLWAKSYGGNGNDLGNSITAASDGGYIITGSLRNLDEQSDVCLIRIDSQGDTLWTKAYGGPYGDGGASIQKTFDGGYIISGHYNQFQDSQVRDVYLLRTDSNGDTLWTKTFGGARYEHGASVRQTSDSGFIVTGRTRSFSDTINDIYLIRTNKNGDSLWTRTYGEISVDDIGREVIQNSEGNFVIAGHKFTADYDYQALLIEVDPKGDTLWTRTYGGEKRDAAESIEQTGDGGYIMVGMSTSFSSEANVYLIRTDTHGDTLWTANYGGDLVDIGREIEKTSDGGYIIAGTTHDLRSDIYLIKLGPDSLGINNHPKKFFTNKGNLYINSRNHTFKFNVPYSTKTRLRLYDSKGTLINTLVDDWRSKGTYHIKWDSSKISNGVYFVILSYGDYSTTVKYIKY